MNQVEKENKSDNKGESNDFEFDFAMCHGSYDNVFNEDKQPYFYCLL